MKFFTRQLYNAQQGDPDLPQVIEAEKEWDIVSDEYQKHLNSVRPKLPKSMKELCDTSLHDGIIRSVEQDGDEISLQIEGCGCWGPGGQLELIFHGVRSTQGIEDIVDDYWLYEEVHLSKDAGFEYHVLLHKSEFIIVADSIKLFEKDH